MTVTAAQTATTLLALAVLALLGPNLRAQQAESERVEGDYFAQKPPGREPAVLGPGIPLHAKAGAQLRLHARCQGGLFHDQAIGPLHANDDGSASVECGGERTVAPFSGEYADVDPFVTQDGTRLYLLVEAAA